MDVQDMEQKVHFRGLIAAFSLYEENVEMDE